MANRDLLDRILKVDAELWRYYNYIHSDKSNDVFDDEHDALLSHLEGLNETIEEMRYDFENGEDLSSWEPLVKDDEECLKQVIAYYKAVINSPRPNYIYG